MNYNLPTYNVATCHLRAGTWSPLFAGFASKFRESAFFGENRHNNNYYYADSYYDVIKHAHRHSTLSSVTVSTAIHVTSCTWQVTPKSDRMDGVVTQYSVVA